MRMLSRREFNALVAAGAAGVLASCTGATQGSATFESGLAVLSFARFPALMSPGGSVVVDVPGRFPIVVVRTSDTAAVALSATCTHAFCLMAFDGARIHCPCHDANFALDGSVLGGPTSVPIPAYAATLAPDAVRVQIDA